MTKNPSSRKKLEEKIRSLLNNPIKITEKGPQGYGNTWQKVLGVEVNNRPGPDWDDIEIKSLSYDEKNPKNGTAMSLSTKAPDWDKLSVHGVTKTSFLHNVDYRYKSVMGSIFFTNKLRYVVSETTRSIDWYVVKPGCPATEPYSLVPARIGERVFSWDIEEVLHKVQKLSVTFLIVRGKYPDGTITPIRSFIINTYPDRFLELLRKGSIVYEVRYGAKDAEDRVLWEEIRSKSESLFPDDDLKKWTWFDNKFLERGGKDHDHGTGFRLGRAALNSMLDFGSEIL